jgi:hypothetical protein
MCHKLWLGVLLNYEITQDTDRVATAFEISVHVKLALRAFSLQEN